MLTKCRDVGNIPDIKREPLTVRDPARVTIAHLDRVHHGSGFIFKVTSKQPTGSATNTLSIARSANETLMSHSREAYGRQLPSPPQSCNIREATRDLARAHAISTMRAFDVGFLPLTVSSEGTRAVDAIAEFLHYMEAHFQTMVKARGCADLQAVLYDLGWGYFPLDPADPCWSGLDPSEVSSLSCMVLMYTLCRISLS